ncbi:MAG: hypothetical protein HY908_32455 [Myxococcales bacterium]|nr:hypothetical protein [Myxococcales bacterium]
MGTRGISTFILLCATALVAGACATTQPATSLAKPEAGPIGVEGLPASRTVGADGVTVYHRELLSKTYHIDKKYRSMFGPDQLLPVVKLVESEVPELLWITGYQAVVVGADGATQMSQEFMCHSNLDWKPADYYKSFGSRAAVSPRLFTLSQGQQNVQFPKGFAIPLVSTVPLSLVTQVLNLNLDKPDIDVRHHVRIDFVRDRDLKEPMKPLFQAAVQGFKTLDDKPGYYSMDPGEATPEEHGAGCGVGKPAVAGDVDKDKFGHRFTGHWEVEPGREENATLVTHFLSLQFDTTVHYIAVHLHPFAESLELRDLTSKEVVFHANVRATPGKIGIEDIDHLSSVEGVKLYKDHQYELVSVYNNTTGAKVDSMAVMYMYLLDSTWKKPDLEALRAEAGGARAAND